uniref:Uncharacterized protein n=1 Tax=Apteryx owenii TaxID=8824 RepID=A0A8B9P0L4_APTOW
SCARIGLDHQRLLMKTGLILIVIGHLNFIAGAFIHGIIPCFMANPQDTTSLQYLVSNLVVSALLVPQGTGAQEDAGVDAVGTQGGCRMDTAWMGMEMDAGCTYIGHGVDGDGCRVCTRWTRSSLSLWTFSLMLYLVQIIFSIRCLLLSLSILRPGHCCRGMHQKKETLAPSPHGSPLPHAAP